MSIIDKAKSAIGKEVKFDIDAGPSINNELPDPINCLVFILWAADLDYNKMTYPRIDWLCNSLKKNNDPMPNNIIAFPSKIIGRGSWEKFVPGCAAIISEVKNNKVSKIIIAHPKVIGIIAEVSPDLFLDKPYSYLEVS